MSIVQHTEVKDNGKKRISINGLNYLENITLGNNVSQSELDCIKRGDRVHLHFSDTGVEICSITKYESIDLSVRNIGLMDEIKVH